MVPFCWQWSGRLFTHFRNPANDNLYVRYGYWNEGRVVSNYNWLDNDWNRHNPAASLANFFISPHLWVGSFVW